MEFVIQDSKNKHLLILIHGLNGSDNTWRGNNQRFVENLRHEKLIKDNFDIALYIYGTKIIEINSLSRITRLFRGLTNNKVKEDAKRFNVGIDKVSMPLVGQLNIIHEKYETISFISHSMGGLVTKSSLTWLENEILNKVHLFISLSVPHIGSHLATIGSKIPVIGKNPQIIGLKAMGEFTTELNKRFGNIKPQPRIIYQWGIQDDIVPEQSAYPPNVPNELTIATQDDHFSVALIKDIKSNFLFRRIINELITLTQKNSEIDNVNCIELQIKNENINKIGVLTLIQKMVKEFQHYKKAQEILLKFKGNYISLNQQSKSSYTKNFLEKLNSISKSKENLIFDENEILNLIKTSINELEK